MRNEQDTAAANAICVLAGVACWGLLIAAPLQMAGVF
jgi:hypothetical protein